MAGVGEAYLPCPTVPRRLHCAVFRLLRPLEVALRHW